METVETPACPFVILIFFVVAVDRVRFSQEDIHPVEKYTDPCSP